MALTPEDVVNKRFQPTKFREGYDQDEVDDFLDEVVVELRRLGQENEELRQRLLASGSRSDEERDESSVVFPAPAPASAEQQSVAAPIVVPAPVETPAEPVSTDTAVADDETENSSNLLQLARKLHEEHVREGIEKRDALIAEGHAAAARLVGEAEETQRTRLDALETERVSLEHRIEDLRTFEREYRQKLKGYIEGQLRELESPDAMTSAPEVPQQATDQEQAEQKPAEPVGYQGFGGN